MFVITQGSVCLFLFLFYVVQISTVIWLQATSPRGIPYTDVPTCSKEDKTGRRDAGAVLFWTNINFRCILRCACMEKEDSDPRGIRFRTPNNSTSYYYSTNNCYNRNCVYPFYEYQPIYIEGCNAPQRLRDPSTHACMHASIRFAQPKREQQQHWLLYIQTIILQQRTYRNKSAFSAPIKDQREKYVLTFVFMIIY